MNKNEWKKRIAERNDMTTYLAHLTKPLDDEIEVYEVLLKILKDRKLEGSGEKGFIVGNTKAVCLQESPLYSLTQNIYYEQKLRKSEKVKKIRYLGFGLLFEKSFVFRNNGRPVIYDKTQEAKAYLPSSQWWRIVNLDLSNDDIIIDWTHEREWRVPNELKFQLKDVSVLVPNKKAYKKMIKICKEENIDLINEVRGIINLQDLLI